VGQVLTVPGFVPLQPVLQEPLVEYPGHVLQVVSVDPPQGALLYLPVEHWVHVAQLPAEVPEQPLE